MPAMKRSLQSASGAPAKRPAASKVRQHLGAVHQEVASAPEAVLPAAAASMLASFVDGTLGTPAAERHEFQLRIVDMVAKALSSSEAHAQAAVEEAKGKVQGVDGDRAARQEALDAAKAALAGMQAAVEQKKEALAAAKAEKAKKQEQLQEQQKAQAAVEAPLQGTLGDLERTKGAIEALQGLKETSSESKPGKQFLKTVLKAGKSFSVDESLLDSLMHVVKKEPASRAGFDLVVVQNIEEAFARLVEGLDKDLAQSAGPRDERIAATKAAEAALEGAEQGVAQAKEALHAATEEEIKSGVAGVKAAQKHSSKWLPDAKVTMDTYDELLEKLAALREGPLASFALLKEMDANYLQEPEPEVPEAAEAGEAAVPSEAQGGEQAPAAPVA